MERNKLRLLNTNDRRERDTVLLMSQTAGLDLDNTYSATVHGSCERQLAFGNIKKELALVCVCVCVYVDRHCRAAHCSTA